MTSIRLAFEPELQDLLLDEDLVGRLEAMGRLSRQLSIDDGGLGSGLARDHEVLITSWGSPALPAQLQSGDRLRFVAHTAGSVRRVLPRSLLLAGVRASQASAAMAEPVAEFALTMTLVMLRHLHVYDRAMIDGTAWKPSATPAYGRTLAHERVGVLGASRTGREYIRMAQGLGAATIQVHDPYLTTSEAADLQVVPVSLDELLTTSTVVAVHAPATEQTRHIIDADALRRLPDGAVLINTARSAVTDEAAVVREVLSGRISVCLDVFDTEPLPPNHPLVGRPNALLSPHRAGATLDARRQQGAIAVGEVERFLRGSPLRHEVTVESYDRLA